MGVNKGAPVGFVNIRLHFTIDTDVEEKKLEKLVQLMERYSFVLQTIKGGTEGDELGA